MSAPVDVLAVLEDAAHAIHIRDHVQERVALLDARAAVAELVDAARFFVNDDRQRAWHPSYRKPMDDLRAALARVQGGAA